MPGPTDLAHDIGNALGLERSQVRAALSKFSGVVDELRQPQLEWVTALWQSVVIGALGRLHVMAHGHEPNPKGVVQWATVAGIATDKLLLLSGRPTSIVAAVHEHRFDLAELAHRLGGVAGRIALPPPRPVVIQHADAADHASPERIAAANPPA